MTNNYRFEFIELKEGKKWRWGVEGRVGSRGEGGEEEGKGQMRRKWWYMEREEEEKERESLGTL